MLIARSPVRISFAGGGTDLEAYYREHGGLVVSTTIDKYFYVFVNLNGGDTVQISSSDYRTFFRQRRGEPILWQGDLSLPRAFLNEFGIDSGLSIFTASEVPPGTGLGSSSTVSVALAKSLGTLCGLHLTPHELAEFASYVEIEKMGMPIGRQDQYAAAFGGLNAFLFGSRGVRVEPLNLDPDVERALDRRIMLFFTGASRSAANILKHQQAASQQPDSDAVAALHRIKQMARTTIELFRAGRLDEFGELLHEKIAGAGGGGFLMLYCQEPQQEAVTAALEEQGLTRMDFHFDSGGAVILMDALPRIRKFGRIQPGVAARIA
jgi:D-glycero-alpha-D-manno-heptose-7-phosphate kinase